MAQIKGTTVKLAVKTQVGVDGFKRPVYEEQLVDIEDVLIGEPTSDELVDTLNLFGKRVAYVLAVPKGDKHLWENTIVEFYGEKYRTIGAPVQGIEENIPLRWNKKVKVERVE